MQLLKAGADFAGRALIGASFIYWGGRKLLETLAVEYGVGAPPPSGGWQSYMEGHGVAYELIPLVILTELGGGILLILGWGTPIVGLALGGFCLLANGFFHTDFSNHANVVIFIKNLALAGGLLVVASGGAGAWSIDYWRRRPA
jgi:putative oxidoreductase